MLFTLNLLVPEPTPELVELMFNKTRTSRVSKNGTLIIRLLTDRKLSHAAYPEEWLDRGEDVRMSRRFSPNFSNGVVHELCELPEELADVNSRPVLEGAEVNLRGSYCQVVTGYNGERLHPYRRESDNSRSMYPTHPTASVFSAPEMGLLRLDANAQREEGLLTIMRAKVSVIDGLVTVVQEQLLCINNPRFATRKLGGLTPELKDWEPALQAHYERWECEARSCDGHYHLDD